MDVWYVNHWRRCKGWCRDRATMQRYLLGTKAGRTLPTRWVHRTATLRRYATGTDRELPVDDSKRLSTQDTQNQHHQQHHPGLPHSETLVRRQSAQAHLQPPFPTLGHSKTTAVAHLTSRSILAVEGDDAASYLMGLTTSNVAKLVHSPLDPQTSRAAFTGQLGAVLSPRGRIVSDIFVFADLHSRKRLYIDCDSQVRERLVRYLSHYILRAKVRLVPVDPTELAVFSMWTTNTSNIINNNSSSYTTTSGFPNENPQLTLQQNAETSFPTNNTSADDVNLFKSLARSSLASEEEHVVSGMMLDSRAPGLGVRCIAFPDMFARALNSVTPTAPSTEHEFTVKRFVQGILEGHNEISSHELIPSEANFDITHGIDFHKGCYLGQELVIRARHKGVTRNRVMPVLVSNSDSKDIESVPEGNTTEDLKQLASSLDTRMAMKKVPNLNNTDTTIVFNGQRSTGKVLSQVGDLCLIRMSLRKALDPSQVSVKNHPELKLKAFVPDWWPDEATKQLTETE